MMQERTARFKTLVLGPSSSTLKEIEHQLRAQKADALTTFDVDVIFASHVFLKDVDFVLAFRKKQSYGVIIIDCVGLDEANARKITFSAGVDAYFCELPANILDFTEEVHKRRRQRSEKPKNQNKVLLLACDVSRFLPTALPTLTAQGWVLHTPAEVYSGLELLRRGYIDAVLSDGTLPGLVEQEFIAAIKRYDPLLKVFQLKIFEKIEDENVLFIPLGMKQLQQSIQENPLSFCARTQLYISDMMEQVQTLHTANIQLRSADAARYMLLSDASHELRNPLAALTASLAILKKENLNEEQKGFVESSIRNVSRLERLIEDLLDLTKYESGRVVLDISTFDLKNLFDDVAMVLQPAAAEKQITLQVKVTELPKFVGDKLKIERVMINLINNAIKYTPKGGSISVEASFNTNQENEGFLIHIKDTGMGMPEADIDRIFEPFFRIARDEQSTTKGTGLGLAIVKNLVELHEGKIQVQSKLNEGTIFSLTFPKLKQDMIALLHVRSAVRFMRRNMANLSVVLLEIQQFKSMKDPPALLNAIAAYLSRLQAEGSDAVELMPEHGRVVTMLTRTNAQECQSFIKKLAESLGKLKTQLHEKFNVQVEFKVGVATYPEQATSAEELLALCEHTLRPLVPIQQAIFDVVVIDDETSMRQLLRRTLAAQGFAVRLAEDGVKGFELVEQKKPDLVICDVMMPNMDGYTFVGALRANAKLRNIPVLILTADPLADVERTLDLGATEFIAKPFSPAVLLSIVQTILKI